ncbi:MAG: hypothetical protein NZL87_05385, partial [Thermomicrobium sp.]|nr:hypothetical protein [Thermomicrobium sp.]
RAFVLAGGLLSIGNGAVVPFYNVFLTTLGLSAQAIGVFYAAASLTGAVLGLFAPAVARALGPLHAATFIRFAPIPLFALLALFPATPLAIVAHLVRMTSISMAWPIDSMLIAEVLPSAVRANAFSFRSAAWNLGFAVASLLSGQLIVALGYGPAFAIYALFCTLAVAYFQRRFRQHPAAQGHRGRVQPASGPER